MMVLRAKIEQREIKMKKSVYEGITIREKTHWSDRKVIRETTMKNLNMSSEIQKPEEKLVIEIGHFYPDDADKLVEMLDTDDLYEGIYDLIYGLIQKRLDEKAEEAEANGEWDKVTEIDDFFNEFDRDFMVYEIRASE